MLLSFLLVLIAGGTLSAQERKPEVLRESRVTARPSARLRRMMPSLGLPVRLSGKPETYLQRKAGRWHAADHSDAPPRWVMWEMEADGPQEPTLLAPLLALSARWAADKPVEPASVVYGYLPDGSLYLALCKRTLSSLGWKSIAFLVPATGPTERDIYRYSLSVNTLERKIGYDLFPKLPDHLQEIIEEISASELLCSAQEFDSGGISEGPDREEEEQAEEQVIE